jgi:hypothetical protein
MIQTLTTNYINGKLNKMTSKTPAERKAAQRKRDKDGGLVRADVAIHPSRREELRMIEKRLQKPKRNPK